MGKPEIASEKVKKLKQELYKKVSMANKRLVRLEKKGMTDSPAYQNWSMDKNGVKFTATGKTYNDLRSEMAKIDKFLNSVTSTIRGSNKVLKEILKNTGVKAKIKPTSNDMKKYFGIVSKIEQLLDSKNQGAVIGYQQVWAGVNQYITDIEGSLKDGDPDKIAETVAKMLEFQKLDEYDEGYADPGSDDFEYFK
ncbi:MAG: hypothetical protein ACRC5T_03160 [Cetobacterium sp.]